MTDLLERPPRTDAPPRRSILARAWTAVLLIPGAFVIAFVVAAVLYDVVDHDPSVATPPHWADVVALVPAGLVFVIPCVFAVRDGRRAARAGHRSGYVAAAIGVVAAIGYALLSAL